jgi:hypothetical protein
VLQVSSNDQEREQGSEDNPNVNAHQSSPAAALPATSSAFRQYTRNIPARGAASSSCFLSAAQPQQPKAVRELSRTAFGMNCRRVPVPFITCGNNRQGCVGFPWTNQVLKLEPSIVAVSKPRPRATSAKPTHWQGSVSGQASYFTTHWLLDQSLPHRFCFLTLTCLYCGAYFLRWGDNR